jgi:hypothetical protein
MSSCDPNILHCAGDTRTTGFLTGFGHLCPKQFTFTGVPHVTSPVLVRTYAQGQYGSLGGGYHVDLQGVGRLVSDLNRNHTLNCLSGPSINWYFEIAPADWNAAVDYDEGNGVGNVRFDFSSDNTGCSDCSGGVNGRVVLDVTFLDEADDCNANGIADSCDIAAGGASTDCNANLIPDECDIAAGGASADCNANLIPDECDVATGGASADCNANLIPDECERLAADPSGFDKCRFISFVPPAAETGEYAIRVDLTSLHHPDPPYVGGEAADFSACEGEGHSRWVGQPTHFFEAGSNGKGFYAAFLCRGEGFCCGGRYDGLACDNVVTFCPEGGHCGPFYSANWGTYGLIHVTGSAIVPSSVYTVYIVPAAGPVCVSPLTVRTTRWGDVAVPFQEPAPAPRTQPNFSDIAAIVSKYRDQPGAPIKARAMLAGVGRFGVINLGKDLIGFADIAACINAYKGLPYPYLIRDCP